MAIQIRRGTNTEWESNNSNIVVGEPAIATDAERFFVGTASGDYAEFANLDIIAPAYDSSASYVVGDVINRQGKLYSCNTPCSGTFNASYWDEKSLAEILKDLENEIDYAQYEIGYANGKLITIDNGASEIPVKDLTVDIEAVQDLHGYDHPWAGGAGKNLLPIVDTPTYSGLTIIKNNDGSYNISGKPNSNGSIEFYNDVLNPIRITEPCIFTSEWNPQGNATIIFSTAESSVAIQTSNSDTLNIPIGEYTRFRIYVNSANTYNFTFKPMLRLASVSDATFEPYTNICPISGWSEIDINVRGKNFLHDVVGHTNPTTVNGVTFTQNSDGSITMNGTTTASTLYYLSNRSATPNGRGVVLQKGTYTLSGIPTGYSSINLRLGCNRGAVSSTLGNDTGSGFTFTESDGGTQYGVWIGMNSGATINNVTVYPMIRRSTDSSRYEPYNGQTYTIDLNGTRYGGTLDVTTGVLTVTHGYKIFNGTETWGAELTTNFYSPSGRGASSVYVSGDKLWCSHAPSLVESASVSYLNCYISTTGNFNIQIPNSIVPHTGTDMKSWVTAQYNNGTPLTIRYPLVTPQVVQLTPTQVRTVLGTNNLWNQMNTNNELAYRISNALN